ncbi:sensor histidine kinase KdpD, partial [Mesorhizobium sp. M7A.F.Ca.US.003.02.2.1]
AVHGARSRSASMPEDDKDRLATNLRLAQQLGAEVTTIPGQNVAQDIVRYATANNFTHIVVGRPTRSRWRELIEGSLTYDLIRNAGDISVHVISGSERGTEAASRSVKAADEQWQFEIRPYLKATAFVIGSLAFAVLLDQFLDVRNLAIILLIGVLASAVTGGLWPALYACFVSALAFNYFFLEPRYTLTIRDPESIVALGVFLVVAVIASNLTARVQRQAVASRSRARATEDIYLFSKKLAGAGTLDDVLWATAFQIASMLKLRVVLLLPEDGTITVKAGYPPDDTLAEADIAAARWAWEHNRAAGRGADTLPGAKRLYLPLRTGRTAIGVVGLDNDKQGPLLTPEQQRLLDALADQAAVAIERIQLVADVDRAKLAAEADRLRSALLTSISHDLKTPLAAIMGAAGTLRDFSAALPEPDRVELLSTVLDEAERLNRFIANLLDMTKIESGAMEPNYAFHYVGDIVGSALQRARKIIGQHKIETDIPRDLPMLKVDPVLFEQALFNLLDNAAKYAPAGSTIRVQGWTDNGSVLLQIMDEGPGIPPGDLERIFDTFYRVRKRDQIRAGTGLGLSICRGFIEAMGGTITAANRTDGSGAVFTIKMPKPANPPNFDASNTDDVGDLA